MGKLYIVSTPIGNLKDITLRSLEILKEVDFILAEDTRTSRKLLQHYAIDTPLKSLHQHNEHRKIPEYLSLIQTGNTAAVISDAGTPGISDPGFLIIREALNLDIEIDCLPGATAFVPALQLSGFPMDKFFFEGFLPHKKGRNKRLTFLSSLKTTIILYESPFRIKKTITQLLSYWPEETMISISREISKLYEETLRGTLIEINKLFDEKKYKGEMVIVIYGKE